MKPILVTPKSLPVVLAKILVLSHEDKVFAKDFSGRLNELLDDMHSEDAFGTEGQMDPRGDHRL